MEATQVKMSLSQLQDAVIELQALVAAQAATIAKLETPTNVAQKEMTDEHARQVIESDKKHNDMAKELGLSYGQVYSCRLGYTFKDVHKAMKAEGKANRWIK